MQGSKANKLIEKILEDLNKDFDYDKAVEYLKELRPLAKEEQDPTIVKLLRLTYEHIEQHGSFNIAIPDDEPIEEGEEVEKVEFDGKESLLYMIGLFSKSDNKMNRMDMASYRDALYAY